MKFKKVLSLFITAVLLSSSMSLKVFAVESIGFAKSFYVTGSAEFVSECEITCKKK